MTNDNEMINETRAVAHARHSEHEPGEARLREACCACARDIWCVCARGRGRLRLGALRLHSRVSPQCAAPPLCVSSAGRERRLRYLRFAKLCENNVGASLSVVCRCHLLSSVARPRTPRLLSPPARLNPRLR